MEDGKKANAPAKPKAPAKGKSAKKGQEAAQQPQEQALAPAAAAVPPQGLKDAVERPVPAQEASSAKPAKSIGGQNFNLDEVPADFKDFVQQRFGVAGEKMKHSVSRADGSYRGEVLVSDNYVAQRVAANSVVYHRRESIEYKNQNLEWRNREGKLNGQAVALHYSGDQAKGYPHNAEKSKDAAGSSPPASAPPASKNLEAFSRMVEAQKKTARDLGLPDAEQFAQTLDVVTSKMMEQLAARQQPRQQAEHQR